jgi:hypothetical protein
MDDLAAAVVLFLPRRLISTMNGRSGFIMVFSSRIIVLVGRVDTDWLAGPERPCHPEGL